MSILATPETMNLFSLSKLPKLDKKIRIRAVKGLIFFNGKILLQLRDNDPRINYPNHWGLFGGEVDQGECPNKAIRRELREELGIELIEETMLFSWVSKCSLAEIIFFYVKVKTEFNLLELNEGQKMAVFYFDELDKLDLTPDIVANKDRFKSFLNGGILAR